MNISKFFINRPIFAIVLALLFILAGLITLTVLPVAQYPNITPPTVNVSATYPGANTQTVAQVVGIPIEEQVNGVEGMLYMESSSTSSGAYSLTVTFDVGTDIDMATVMVQNRVNIAQPGLPTTVTQQGISVQKRSTNIVMFISLTGDSVYDDLYLGNYAQLQLVNQLSRVPGVGEVSVIGSGNYAMRVWLDPEAMRIRNLTPQQVYEAIASQNMEVSAGYVGQDIGQPREENNAFQFTLSVQGRLTTPEEFGNIVLRVDGNRLLRLQDVATIELGSQSYGTVSRLDGKPSAAIGIYQLPGSNALDVAEAVEAKMAELSQAFPPGIYYHVPLNTTDVVRSSITEVLRTFLEALLLVVIVIFVFLQNGRATLIPCITIPVALIGTLVVMELFGFSINTLSLFGLILAIAIVVDDAIVVVENATRLMDSGQYPDARKATEAAMGEITGPIVGVVLVLLAVFIPTTLISGITGQLFKQFALTIATSTVISGFSALTLTPALCALFLKPTPQKKSLFFRTFDRVYGFFQKGYDGTVRYFLKRSWLAFLTFILFSALGIAMFMRWPTSFVPQEDDGYFIVAVQLPPAASLERTEKVDARIGAILQTYPEVKTVIGLSGFSMMTGGQQTNAGTYFVVLKDFNERKGKEHSAAALIERFNGQAYEEIQEATAFALSPSSIPGMGVTGGLELELEDRNSMGTLAMQSAVDQLLENYHTVPAIGSMTCYYQADVPLYFLNIHRDKVQLMGLDLSNVFAALSYYMGQAYVNNFVQFGRVWQVKIGAGEGAQKYIADVMRLSVQNSQGKMVPFSSFTTIEEQLGIDQLTRYNMYNAAMITVNPAKGYSSGETIQAMEQYIRQQLGNNYGYEWTSLAYQESSSGNTTTAILLVALLVVYLVLAAQYESWTSPIAAIMGVPIALLGAIVGCWIVGLPVSIYTLIGLILLVALSAKNGILIVEFARDYRNAGNSIFESAYQGGHVRLRPILMTSLAFVFGLLPLLFASGAGAASRVSLGTAVVFGMLLNTLLATVYIPNWYELMQRIQEKLAPKSAPKVLASNTEVETKEAESI